MSKYISLLFIIFPLFIYSQKKIESTYYSISIPDIFEYQDFKSEKEQTANIESYQLLVNSSPICLLYLMSNKLEIPVFINEENYNDFIYDIGDLVISKVVKNETYLKIYYKYENKDIAGILYLGNKNDILTRFVFMFPNEKFLIEYDNKVELIIGNFKYKKEYW